MNAKMTIFLRVRKLCSFQDGDQDDTLQLYYKEVVRDDERDEEKSLNNQHSYLEVEPTTLM